MDQTNQPRTPDRLRRHPDHIGALSGGERRLLRIAASIGSHDAAPVDRGEAISGLDRLTLHHILAAIAHAGGSHQHTDLNIDQNNHVTVVKQSSLYSWNED